MISYRPLFDVDITHDYFLSRGDVVLEAQADVDRTALANLYSVGDFLDVFPDDATKAVLAGHKMLFRTTAAGFSVVAANEVLRSLNPLTISATDGLVSTGAAGDYKTMQGTGASDSPARKSTVIRGWLPSLTFYVRPLDADRAMR